MLQDVIPARAAVLEAVNSAPDLWQGRILTGAFLPGVSERDYAAIGLQTTVEFHRMVPPYRGAVNLAAKQGPRTCVRHAGTRPSAVVADAASCANRRACRQRR